MKCLGKYPLARLAGMLGLACALVLPGFATYAQTTDPFADPFEANSGTWKSFDRYKEEQKEKLLSEITGNPEADAKAIADQNAADAKNAADAANATDAKKPATASGTEAKYLDGKSVQDTASVLAPPDRPLEPPVMPALTAQFNIPVSTTDDDHPSLAHVAHIDTEPDLQLPQQNWLNAAEAAQLNAEGKSADDEKVPLNIRLSFLPSFKAPELQRKSTPVLTVLAAKPKSAPQLAADTAACAAIDAYKKRELEAIQSDRHTLSALQDAIKELGLSKQLNFMAGGDSKINTPTDANPFAPASP